MRGHDDWCAISQDDDGALRAGPSVSLDRLDLRAWSDGRAKPAVSRAGRQARWTAVTWMTAGRGGAGVGCASHRSCGVLPS